MSLRREDTETICALSTPPGRGALSVVRISGPSSLEIARRVAPLLPARPEAHHAYFVRLRRRGNAGIDEALATYFAEGRSYTGEQTVEISGHGNPAVVGQLLNELVAAGARMALPGEFTYRAFMNGKLDLVQAESVLALIESRSARAAEVALSHLKGGLSKEFERLEDRMLWACAHLEASIDFSAEGLDVVDMQALREKLATMLGDVASLLRTYEKGRILRDGLQVVLLGQPNVGKSSLLNAFLQEDKAIVTAEPGTTRDVITGSMEENGISMQLHDTAGLRETQNDIERLGIERSKRALSQAQVVLFLSQNERAELARDLDIAEGLRGDLAGKHVILLLSKSDQTKASALTVDEQKQLLATLGAECALNVSSQTRQGLAELQAKLMGLAEGDSNVDSAGVLTQARHYEILRKLEGSLQRALQQVDRDGGAEHVVFELNYGVRAVHELLGKSYDEQVIDRIFSEFCLGK